MSVNVAHTSKRGGRPEGTSEKNYAMFDDGVTLFLYLVQFQSVLYSNLFVAIYHKV